MFFSFFFSFFGSSWYFVADLRFPPNVATIKQHDKFSANKQQRPKQQQPKQQQNGQKKWPSKSPTTTTDAVSIFASIWIQLFFSCPVLYLTFSRWDFFFHYFHSESVFFFFSFVIYSFVYFARITAKKRMCTNRIK